MLANRKIVIIGTGHVGSHCAYALAIQGICDEIVLVDKDRTKAKSHSMDIADSVSFFNSSVIVRCGDYSDCKDADIIEFHAPELDAADLDDAADLTGADMPSPSAYLSAQQKNGKPLGADIVYKETWLWLKQRGCEKHVNKRLLESYSQAFARFVQCEEALSTYGLLGKHPTTGGVIASPFVQMSQTFQKQANLLWYEIFDIVKQNCTTKFDGTPQDDLMEQLLSSRK